MSSAIAAASSAELYARLLAPALTQNVAMAAALKAVSAGNEAQAQALELIQDVCLPDNCTFSTYA